LAIAALLVANLGRIPFVSGGDKDAPILINDLFVMALVLAAVVTAGRARRPRLDRGIAYALLFAAVGAVSTLLAIPRFELSPFEFVFSIAYLARWLLYLGLYFAVINFVRSEDVWDVWKTLERVILVFAVFGIFQSLLLPDFAQLVYPNSDAYVDWDPQGHRLVSTFLDPNYAGMFILMGLLVQLALLSAGDDVPVWKPALLLGALVLTVSRSSVLGLIAGGAVILTVRGVSIRLLRVMAGFTMALLLLSPLIINFAGDYRKFSIDASALARVVSWLRALEIFADHPILGIGFNTYGFVQRAYDFTASGNASFGLDASLLFIGVMTGSVGLLIYLVMVATLFGYSRSVWRDSGRPAREKGFAIGVGAVTVAILVHSVFLNSLLYPFLMEPLWIMWGLTYILSTNSADTRPAPAHRIERIPRNHGKAVGSVA
jgi:hypothetical protein